MTKKELEMSIPKISFDELFTTQKQRDEAKLEKVQNIPLDLIDEFPNHPFKVLDNDEEVEMTDTIKKIINQASKIEHDIIMNKIIKIDDQYFVVIELNVNLWTPYEFYYYNNKKDKLVEIETFDNYDVVGIKIK